MMWSAVGDSDPTVSTPATSSAELRITKSKVFPSLCVHSLTIWSPSKSSSIVSPALLDQFLSQSMSGMLKDANITRGRGGMTHTHRPLSYPSLFEENVWDFVALQQKYHFRFFIFLNYNITLQLYHSNVYVLTAQTNNNFNYTELYNLFFLKMNAVL